jgi:hypothetical protein
MMHDQEHSTHFNSQKLFTNFIYKLFYLLTKQLGIRKLITYILGV